jgi:tmRNA-binding protein
VGTRRGESRRGKIACEGGRGEKRAGKREGEREREREKEKKRHAKPFQVS